uniref:Putative secreted protein n=1 Tax=Anopheles triannulatus TaxID=58253 RepID=A0A2M4B7Q7_9DIPT
MMLASCCWIVAELAFSVSSSSCICLPRSISWRSCLRNSSNSDGFRLVVPFLPPPSSSARPSSELTSSLSIAFRMLESS